MKPEELFEKAKEMLNDGKLDEAKEFIEEHKEDIGEKIHDLTDMFGDNAEGILNKVKGLFGKK
ncbi:hypothetical protein G7081_01575 [Vagococcus coleopterorum]|uniref:Isoleucyl-tRNA synthetase n=1 Tax=Vagococcus coleopterorum TaxID=2714946 RepID=A0A6G8ALN5_9ENTE|nr:hypothetical protein [Vagococcus coleopterorum]QIL45872.1 hypothetical protein G7081_01575 [Vagococcus coleopterorum]